MTGSALRDPIYQLNFVLWMLEEFPPAAPTRPLLRQMGYTLHSLGGGLPMPPELRVRIHEVFEGETGRRLYLIPWDPSVSQTPEERQLCQRILFERVLAEALALAGRACVPGEVHFPVDTLLDRATFTLARRWRARQDIKHITHTIHRFLRVTIERHPRKFATRWDAMIRTLVVPMGSAGEHGELLRALEEGQPAEWLKGRDMQQPELFEDGAER